MEAMRNMWITSKPTKGVRKFRFIDEDLKRLKKHALLPTREMICLSKSEVLGLLSRLGASERILPYLKLIDRLWWFQPSPTTLTCANCVAGQHLRYMNRHHEECPAQVLHEVLLAWKKTSND